MTGCVLLLACSSGHPHECATSFFDVILVSVYPRIGTEQSNCLLDSACVYNAKCIITCTCPVWSLHKTMIMSSGMCVCSISVRVHVAWRFFTGSCSCCCSCPGPLKHACCTFYIHCIVLFLKKNCIYIYIYAHMCARCC